MERMFEKFSEESRRIIFFARYEAAMFGSPTIETEHLLLGLMRDARGKVEAYLSVSSHAWEAIRKQIEAQSATAQGQTKLSTSVDLPLSPETMVVVSRAYQEATDMDAEEVRPSHLLLALQRGETLASRILREHGAAYDAMRQKMLDERADHGGPSAPSLADTAARLRKLIAETKRALTLVDHKRAATPMHEGGWSPKQILGHLIDSASNNHQRFVRALIQPELTWPNYEQESWVASQAYATTGWGTLVQFWTDYNMHLLRVIAHIPEEKTGTICRIGDEKPMTLGELISSYIDHLDHHLNQILG